MILKELYPRNCTWGASSVPGPDTDDAVMDLAPECDTIMDWVFQVRVMGYILYERNVNQKADFPKIITIFPLPHALLEPCYSFQEIDSVLLKLGWVFVTVLVNRVWQKWCYLASKTMSKECHAALPWSLAMLTLGTQTKSQWKWEKLRSLPSTHSLAWTPSGQTVVLASLPCEWSCWK